MTPKKYTKFYTPKNIHFLKTPKSIEIQNFEPQKMSRAYICMKLSEYPPPPPPWTARQQPRDWASLFNFSESDRRMGGTAITYKLCD